MVMVVIIVSDVLHDWICIQTLAFKLDYPFNSEINVCSLKEKKKTKPAKRPKPKQINSATDPSSFFPLHFHDVSTLFSILWNAPKVIFYTSFKAVLLPSSLMYSNLKSPW